MKGRGEASFYRVTCKVHILSALQLRLFLCFCIDTHWYLCFDFYPIYKTVSSDFDTQFENTLFSCVYLSHSCTLNVACLVLISGQWKRNATRWHPQYVWSRSVGNLLPELFVKQHFFSFFWLLLVTSLSVHLSILVVLSGTKYGLKQTRGKFGLGAKMVLTTGTRYIYFLSM